MYKQIRTVHLFTALAFVLLLSACNISNETASTESVAKAESGLQANNEVTEQQAGYPRTVKHEDGVITLDSRPEKIISIDEDIIDILSLLGHSPLGSEGLDEVADSALFAPYIEGKDIINMGNRMNLETLLDMDVDLLIFTSDKVRELDSLKDIAPYAVVAGGADYRTRIRQLGELLGEEQQAEAIIEDYDQQVETVKAEMPSDFEETVLVLRANGKDFTALSTEEFGLLFNELGFKPVKGMEAGGQLTIEGISAANPDHIIIAESIRESDPKKPNGLINMWEENPVWKSLSAVKNGNVHTVDKLLIEPVFSAQFEILKLAKEIIGG
ncbi:ABC transporter substrate-binding protein [Paenibacillus pinistramenti]|uniref:ABC transporter substrate-binding protein n=1 Tax=Paenibacillus pinistramenti TaxID=1768003 RepID=UPI001108D721|nr:ABC transporter substrate-binding protein [Paenibacillus pinistramenti]